MVATLGATVAAVGASDGGAQAEPTSPALSGTWTMTSEQGDPVGRGLTYSFGLKTISPTTPPGALRVEATGSAFWSIRLAGPGGAHLEERVYPRASRFPAATEALLDVSGDSRSCNEAFGRFTVHDVEYADDHLSRLHMTFEQRCEQPDSPALRGEVDIVSEPPLAPLAPLAIGVFIGNLGLAHGKLEVRGSIECSQDARATVLVEVAESARPDTAIAHGSRDLSCSARSTDWRIAVARDDGTPMEQGSFEVKVEAAALDQRRTDDAGTPVHSLAEASAGLSHSGAETAAASGATEAADAITGHVAREPALSLVVWFVCLVAAVLVAALVTLLVIRRRARPSEPS